MSDDQTVSVEFLARQLADQKRINSELLKGNGGGGTFDGMEARVAKIESDLGHLTRDAGEMKTDIREMRKDSRSDFRMLFGAIITVAIGLAALIARGFEWL